MKAPVNFAFFRHRRLWVAMLAAVLAAAPPTAHAQADLSRASAVSGLAVAVSVAASMALLSAGAVLGVAVQTVAQGTVLVLERVSDGARASIRLAGDAASGLSVAGGTAVLVTALSTGWLLSTAADGASRVLVFVPNEAGATLLYSERITR